MWKFYELLGNGWQYEYIIFKIEVVDLNMFTEDTVSDCSINLKEKPDVTVFSDWEGVGGQDADDRSWRVLAREGPLWILVFQHSEQEWRSVLCVHQYHILRGREGCRGGPVCVQGARGPLSQWWHTTLGQVSLEKIAS